MVNVAICDDEIKTGAELERALIDIFDKLNIKCEIDIFFSGEELCDKMQAGVYYDLIFLDIEFAQDAINGVEVGRLIREVHKNLLVSIVYISWEKNYALQLFDTQPLHFLIKPLQHEKIEAVVKKHLTTAGLRSGYFAYKKGHDSFKVQIKDITYLESYDRKLVLHLADGNKDEFYGSLKEMYQQQLRGFEFLFIHNSYLVNFEHITALKYNEVFLANCLSPLPISKNRRGEVRERYFSIMQSRLG